MKRDTLVAEIYVYLNHEDLDLVKAATSLGVAALPSLKKIISTDDQLAPRALLLQKLIRLCWDLPLIEKPEKPKRTKFGTGMKSIATNSPDGHIKGFGCDMLRGKK